MDGLTSREAGELVADVRYLKDCCDKMNKVITTLDDKVDTNQSTTSKWLISILTALVLSLITLAFNLYFMRK